MKGRKPKGCYWNHMYRCIVANSMKWQRQNPCQLWAPYVYQGSIIIVVLLVE